MADRGCSRLASSAGQARGGAPRGCFRKQLGDPMVFGVGLQALGHLLVNATPAVSNAIVH